MLKFLFLLTPILGSFKTLAQKGGIREKLYVLEEKVINGQKEALIELAGYLDDSTRFTEFLGHHIYETEARAVAYRMIDENLLLTPAEKPKNAQPGAKEMLAILQDPRLHFDDLSCTFLITPLNKRSTSYELKQLSRTDQQRIDSTIGIEPYGYWYYTNQIDGFLVQKKPEALLWIAASWYQHRSRFNRYNFDDAPFLDLMRQLTRTDLEVPDENGRLNKLMHGSIIRDAEQLNYLIYWATHYIDYRWNNEKGYFENILQDIPQISTLENVFEKTKSGNDSIALDALYRISESDTGEVALLSDIYERNFIRANFELPTFVYRFTKQLAYYTQYCRDQQLNYHPKGWLLDSLQTLQSDIPFGRRYQLENQLARQLRLEDIHALEYYGLIHEKAWELTFSMGRILDKFYSAQRQQLFRDPKTLEAFLKKAALFKRLGIIGICNKYLRKLRNLEAAERKMINDLLSTTPDPDIRESCQLVLKQNATIPSVQKDSPKKEKTPVADFKSSYAAVIKKFKGDDRQYRVSDLLGITPYEQIAIAARMVIRDSIFDESDFLRILESDYGMEFDSMSEFYEVYTTRDEKGLYQYLFNKTGIPSCYLPDGKMDYEQVYDFLKYGLVDAFVGGGGGRRKIGIYAMLKLLELQFRTRLGFPRKFCEQGSPGIYHDPTERARAWMKYLETQRLVSDKSKDPISFSD